jgi:chromosome segregation protein
MRPAQIDDLERQTGEKVNQKAELLTRLTEEELGLKKIRMEIQEQEKNISIYQAQKQDVSSEVTKLQEELELVKSEVDEATASLSHLKVTEDELIHQLDALNQELSSSQMKIREIQEAIAAKIQEREQITLYISQIEAELASLKARQNGHLEKMTMLQESLDNSNQERDRLQTEASDLDGKKDQYIREIEILKEKIGQLKTEKNSIQSTLTGYERQKEEVAQRLNSIRANINSYAQQAEAIRNALHQQQLEEQEIGFQEKGIRDRLMQTYKIDLDTFVPQAPVPAAEPGEGQPSEPSPPSDDLDCSELLVAIERLRKRCESFGSVNLVAIEEFDQLRERFEFLTRQQSDLITAKESLHQTITKINRQTRQMFMDTFTRVSEEFRIYYRMLFGGGEAQLVLLDPENVLESGIEIIARPPGKKLQNISLLSGGEKSLTAIALIFGVFKVNPSPFCVLDEIDAALDESNVGRFGYLLKDFAKIAQFIVITHNKKTISCADVMYGITMQETGISKIMSVKFKDQESKPAEDAVPAGVEAV